MVVISNFWNMDRNYFFCLFDLCVFGLEKIVKVFYNNIGGK